MIYVIIIDKVTDMFCFVWVDVLIIIIIIIIIILLKSLVFNKNNNHFDKVNVTSPVAAVAGFLQVAGGVTYLCACV